MPDTPPVLEARGVGVRYGQTAVLEGVNLRVRAGEIVALLGASGVGKSSLLRILGGLQAPAAGTVHFAGELLTKPHPESAFAFQSPSLLPWLNVERNVAFGLDFKHQPALSAAQRQERVRQALEEVGLWPFHRHFPRQLSGGMAQRVALARCFARQPRLLLLDEPFSALDEVARGEMQRLLAELLERHHTATVLITHDIDEALLLADRVVLLGRSAAGQSAETLQEWVLTPPRPRPVTSDELAALRLDVLRHLYAAQQRSPAH